MTPRRQPTATTDSRAPAQGGGFCRTSTRRARHPAKPPAPHIPRPTLQDLRRVYLTAAKLGDIPATPATARANFGKLLTIAAAAGLSEQSELTDLTEASITAWRAAQYRAAGLTAPDALTNYRLNSTLRQAQSVFSAAARRVYARAGLTLTEATADFYTRPPFRPQARPTFRPIDAATDAAILRLARERLQPPTPPPDAAARAPAPEQPPDAHAPDAPADAAPEPPPDTARAPDAAARRKAPTPSGEGRGDTDTYPRQNEAPLPLSALGAVMVEMARLCAMTVKEIHYFRRSWVIQTSAGLKIDIREDGRGFSTKCATKTRQIPLSPEVWARWSKVLPLGDAAPFGEYRDYTSPQSEYSRTSRWLGQFLPDRQKKLHELRKMACSQVLARERDIYAAAYFIGDSVQTTAKYYAAQLREIRPLE